MLVQKAAGYKYEVIAETLGITYTNADWHMTLGRAELRQLRDAA